jgi:two-component system response regulator HydG
MSGIELCEMIVANRPDIPVVVMTAFGSLETAVAAIRVGAFDFVTKPIEMDLLAIALERAVKHCRLQEQVKLLTERVEEAGRLGDIIGDSPAMQALFDQLTRVADSESSILITGESGTGKELVARLLHKHSRRAKAPFIPVNCAAIPETLLESELFGHAKGAFTDARTERKGLFQQAEGGTLFLDEIGEMPAPMQAKLLRALEEGKLRPVGGDMEISFDVRVLSATNRDLETAIEEGRFRDDLYFRINVIQLDVPPLRARGTDVFSASIEPFPRFRLIALVDGDSRVTELFDLLGHFTQGHIGRQLHNDGPGCHDLARGDSVQVEHVAHKFGLV